jgi:hypothetical protein
MHEQSNLIYWKVTWTEGLLKKKQEAEDLDQIKRRLDWFLIR